MIDVSELFEYCWYHMKLLQLLFHYSYHYYCVIIFILLFLSSTPKHGDCLQKKKQLGANLEQKLDNGIDRTLSAIVSYVRHVLSTEQKRTDFRPENEDIMIANVTTVGKTSVVIILYFSGGYISK